MILRKKLVIYLPKTREMPAELGKGSSVKGSRSCIVASGTMVQLVLEHYKEMLG